MKDQELDVYLVLILFMLKKEKSLPSKILGKWNIQKQSNVLTLQKFSTEIWRQNCELETGSSSSSKFFEWHFYWDFQFM